MIPIQLQGATQFHAPPGMEDRCGTLPVIRKDGSLVSVWTFSDSERAAIALGANLALTVISYNQPPVKLTVVDIKGAAAPGFEGSAPDPAPVQTDLARITTAVKVVMDSNPDKVAQARLNCTLIPWFTGRVMKALHGKADALDVRFAVLRAFNLSTPDAAR